jgi:integrase
VVQNAVLVGGAILVGTPKAHKRRSVPGPPFLLPAIVEAMRGERQTDLLFSDPAGRHLCTPTVHQYSWLDRALVAAGLPPMTVHDLRHTAASLAVRSGASVKAVQKMLGHASAAMTLDVYTDLFDDDLDALAQRLDEAAARSGVVKMSSSAAQRRNAAERAKKALRPRRFRACGADGT